MTTNQKAVLTVVKAHGITTVAQVSHECGLAEAKVYRALIPLLRERKCYMVDGTLYSRT